MKNQSDDYKNIPHLNWVESIARLLDNKFTFPGTNFKFGLDPIIGLIPGFGSIPTMLVSGGLILAMAKHGVSRKVIILMILNVMVDTILGSIPLIGNIFDFSFKSNIKNINLLKKHYAEGKYQGSGTGILILITLSLLLTFGLILFGVYKLFHYLIGLF